MKTSTVTMLSANLSPEQVRVEWYKHHKCKYGDGYGYYGYWVCPCEAPKNWFFVYDVHYTHRCLKSGRVEGVAPPVPPICDSNSVW